jgi:hypothetical protein
MKLIRTNGYTLSCRQQIWVVNFVHDRLENALRMGLRDVVPFKSDQDRFEKMRNGTAGELVFRDLTGLPVEWRSDRIDSFDSHYRFFTIDTKTSCWVPRKNAKLFVKKRQTKRKDAYVSMWGIWPGPYYLRGVMWRDDILQPYRQDTDRWDAYMAFEHELMPWEAWTKEADRRRDN